MNTLRSIGVLIAILFAAPALAQSPNNAIWGVTAQNEVFSWNPARRQFEQMPGSLKQVSVGTDGEVWGVGPSENVLRWTGSQWQQVSGVTLTQLSVRNAQEVWGVNASNTLFRWNGSAWEQIPSTLKYVSVGADGTVCGISSVDGHAYRRVGSNWTPMPSTREFKRLSVSNAQRVYGIDKAGLVWQWTGTDWVAPGLGGQNQRDLAETANGELWLVAETGSIYFTKDNGHNWERMLPLTLSLEEIAAGAARTGVPELSAEQQQTLDAHNGERRLYPGVGALQWAPELARWAQEWAQNLASRDVGGEHRSDQLNNPFKTGEYVGENIYWSSRSAAGPEATQSWINEKQWYDYGQDDGMAGYGNQPPGCKAPPGKYCGHFTQVIWKNTQYVGCGKATAASGRGYIVCNYYPSGNWRGEKPY